MSISKFRVPKYCLHKATGRARVRVDGKYQFLPGKYDSRESRKAYQQVVDQLTEKFLDYAKTVTSSTEPAIGNCLVSELLIAYLQHADVYYAESETPRNIRYAMRGIRELYPGRQVDAIGVVEWERIRQWFVDKGHSRTGINLSMSRVLQMFKWGVGRQLVRPSTHQTLKAVEPLKKGRCDPLIPETEKRQPVPLEDVNAIKVHVSPTIWAMVQTQLLTGARPGEICKLTTGDIDRSADVWVYRPEKHKNSWRNKERVIFIGPRAQLILAPFLSADPDAPMFSPKKAMMEKWESERQNAKAPLYGRRKARAEAQGLGGNYLDKLSDQYSPGSYRTAIKRACVRAGVKEWTPYQLRHAAGQDARNQFGIEGTSARLGNSIDAATIYAEKNHRLARELAALCG